MVIREGVNEEKIKSLKLFQLKLYIFKKYENYFISLIYKD